ncbi:7-cyano-7-deazaguanine synthase [Arsenicibacter rosenii]|uniref:Asparagine synthetase domain-containing protein n=1 Tax=Arsenicibacter rosenii TaxID=1750698 RepID=A0A1S2VRU4_9BACT|nr:7-cyano-7-deazaguanine synthase [Arsenicibacter rosenii]OIN61210.1 hypothetical protein BLX24_03880 [Arsenicibacter rosenii]
MDDKSVAMLFSGGRDSSLATCILANENSKIHLLSMFNGAVVKGDISQYRYNEIKEKFPNNIISFNILSSFSLFRRIALLDIEKDFERFKYNLIPVGDALATHTIAVIYCIQNKINNLASGYVKYEMDFPEQLPDVVARTSEFVKKYGINYLTPVYEYDSLDKVKYRLFDFGISTKSLEGTSLFADTYSVPPPNVVLDYLDLKLPICDEYIKFMLNL